MSKQTFTNNDTIKFNKINPKHFHQNSNILKIKILSFSFYDKIS